MNNNNKKESKFLNFLIISRIIFIVFIVACLMCDLYGVYSPQLYKIIDFTQRYDDGYAIYTNESLLVFISGLLFLLSCVCYFLEKYLSKKKDFFSKLNNSSSDILFNILIISTLMVLAWHDYMVIVWPIIIFSLYMINLNIKNKIIINKLKIKTNKLLNYATLFQIICVCWILFIFNNNEYRDHIIMWWVVQNSFSYIMIIISIIACVRNGLNYNKTLKGKKYAKQD